MKYLNSILIFFLFLFSCSFTKTTKKKYFEFNPKNSEINIVEFQVKDKIEIPYDSFMKYEFQENDTSYVLTGIKSHTREIYIYNINKKTKSVNRKNINFKFDLESLFDFGYINKDSIFIKYPPAYRNFYHDSILFIMNDKGIIKHFFSFDNTPVLCKHNPQYENNDEAVYSIFNFMEPFNYRDNKLFLNFVSKTQVLGDPAYENLPIAGYLETKTDNFHIIPIDYPDIDYGKTYFPESYKRYFSVLGSKNKIIYAFKYTPKIIEYDYEVEKYQNRLIKSSIYDTIFPSLSEKEVPGGFDLQYPYPEYFNIFYDKYRKLYYRFMVSPREYGNRISLIVADENFDFLAEGFPPTGFRLFFTKDYIISLSSGNKNIKAPKGKIFLTFYKLKFRDGTNQELIAQIKALKKDKTLINKPVTHYIKKNTKIKNKNYTTTFMYYEMCSKTRDFVLGFYQFNKEKFSKNKIFLILVSENINALRTDLKRFDLLPENNPNIIIDSSYTFASYNGNKRNDLPRIVKVRNNKITADTIFNTEDKEFASKFQMFIINSGKEQKALKEKKESQHKN